MYHELLTEKMCQVTENRKGTLQEAIIKLCKTHASMSDQEFKERLEFVLEFCV